MKLCRILFFVAIALPVCTFSSNLHAQVRNNWETLPVFSDGRIMPLHTFAQRIVKDICGTSRPFITRDDTVIAELNRIIDLFKAQEQKIEERSQQQFVDVSSETATDKSYRFLIRGNDLTGGFGRKYGDLDEEVEMEQVQSTLPIKGLTRIRAEQLAVRIRLLVPAQGRYFDADELLLSWIGESEVWNFIPIFLINDDDYESEVLERTVSNALTRQHRVSLFQLSQSLPFQQRLADIEHRRQIGQTEVIPIRFDQITERIQRQSEMFQELTYHPRRSRPTRLLGLLQRASGIMGGEASYASAFEAWDHLLAVGEVPARQSTQPLSSFPKDEIAPVLHPTTQRWHDVADKLRLLLRIFDKTDSSGKMVSPNPHAVESQFELLIEMIDTNLEESAALMESVYPQNSFRSPNQKETGTQVAKLLPLFLSPNNQTQNKDLIRRLVPSYYYAVKTLRYEVEAAYLALYDNGHSLRVLPIHSVLAAGGTGDSHETFGVQPWASTQMLVSSGEVFVQRFFDPRFKAALISKALPSTEDIATKVETKEEAKDESLEPLLVLSRAINPETAQSENAENAESATQAESEEVAGEVKDEDVPLLSEAEQKLEKELFSKPDFNEELIYEEQPSTAKLTGPVSAIRNSLGTLVATYASSGSTYGDLNFCERAGQLQQSLRDAASQVEQLRKTLADTEDTRTAEILAKTAYPPQQTTISEYRYDKLDPFFWMWVFAAASAVVVLVSHVLSTFRRESIDKSAPDSEKKEKTEEVRSDYSNTLEEWLLGIGVVCLALSILITFIGGAMRAWISGWAPVTNMYETVVLMAFSASLFGLWYSFYPLIHPALQLAWNYSSFPSPIHLVRFLMRRSQPKVQRQETDGEVAMREAASEFGLPGGVAMGSAPLRQSELSPEEWEEKRLNQIEGRKIGWQFLTFLPRLCLMLLTFWFVVSLSNGEYMRDHGFAAAAGDLLRMNDFIDWLVVVASIVLIVWIVPQMFLTMLITPFVLAFPSLIAAELGIVSYAEPVVPNRPIARSELSGVFQGETGGFAASATDNSGSVWLQSARNAILDRKLFVLIAAVIAFLAGLTAHLNSTEFNPDIRPIAAVLRSNFWLTVHVIAIVVSYAAAFVAWGMAAVALGFAIFGRYQRLTTESERTAVAMPARCELFFPIIYKLIQVSLLLLVIGTVLGARWADYSWGRFWSWDPKEVWALITIIFYVIVLHGRIARYYGPIGIMLGALLSSIAVIVTWYGINFVFKGSIHSYGSGAASHATLFMGMFIVFNILWGTLAAFRYAAEMYERETEADSPQTS
jgi:ABC-type transport system involved in cytochrome c biogenesis permease subunit